MINNSNAIGKGKLAVGFSLLLATLAAVAIVSILFIVRLEQQNNYLQYYPLERLLILSQIEADVLEMRHMAAMIALHAGNDAELNMVNDDINILRTRTRLLLDIYTHNLLDDPRMSEALRAEAIMFVQVMENRIMHYFTEIVHPLLEIALYAPHNEAEITLLLSHGIEIYASIESIIIGLSEMTRVTVEELNFQTSELTNTAVMSIILVTTVGFSFGLIVIVILYIGKKRKSS